MKTINDITIILDRSGSMDSIKKATIDGFNSFLKEYKFLGLNTKITLVQFDHQYELVYQSKDIELAENLNKNTFLPRGTTALLDAIGKTISIKKTAMRKMDILEKPKNIIVAIITDGFENSSKIYTRKQIFKKVNKRKQKDNWAFMFLAANQDAIIEGAKFGVSEELCLSIKSSKSGVTDAFGAVIKQSKKMSVKNNY